MKIKNGVILAGLDIEMRPVLIAADKIWKAHGQELVVTSGLEGTHSAGSMHYYGLALDFRTRYFEDDGAAVNVELQCELDNLFRGDYDVILHSSHIHVEYDPEYDPK